MSEQIDSSSGVDKDRHLDELVHDTRRADQGQLEVDIRDDEGFSHFCEYHGVQLRALGVPISLHYQVYKKVKADLFGLVEATGEG